jgi:hypothetical protein
VFGFVDILGDISLGIHLKICQQGKWVGPSLDIISANEPFDLCCSLDIVVKVSNSKNGQYILFLLLLDFVLSDGEIKGVGVRE